MLDEAKLPGGSVLLLGPGRWTFVRSRHIQHHCAKVLNVRTTLDLSDEAYALAKSIAHEQNLGLGRTVSKIIIDYAHAPPAALPDITLENGLPVVSIGRRVTSEDVRAILDESE